ncbi:M15 family metallopeptidase [Clostridium lundense]|uniref:M15 family metallopeptidase n=1 Tax=Clostridium lundense TaxID=319475 RepID=UPI0004868B89|nr:M15 family metallopeptidase [Clostridium lundense]
MKRIIYCIVGMFLFVRINFPTKASAKDTDYEVTMKQDLFCLMMAYPEYVKGIQYNEDKTVYLVMKSGRKILYDDRKSKNFEEKLAYPDLQDMMEDLYPLSSVTKLMDKNFDPGRCRVYPLLEEVYGNSKGQIERSLVIVNCGGKRYQFNSNNNAAEALKNVMEEVIPLSASRGDIANCLYPANGTYNYRVISGTNRLSPHAFGIAIDLARDKRDYWKWASREEGEKRLLSYSKELVEIFEKNNFVWGGKWGHFDTLHFEYRPEIILKGRCFSNKHEIEEPWYKGVSLEDDTARNYVEKINQVFK